MDHSDPEEAGKDREFDRDASTRDLLIGIFSGGYHADGTYVWNTFTSKFVDWVNEVVEKTVNEDPCNVLHTQVEPILVACTYSLHN